MAKLFGVLMLLVGLSLGSCGEDGLGYVCDNTNEPVGDCATVQICCKAGGSCYYQANGRKFSCNAATDCTQAVTNLTEFCTGTEIPSVDLSGFEIPN